MEWDEQQKALARRLKGNGSIDRESERRQSENKVEIKIRRGVFRVFKLNTWCTEKYGMY